MNNQSTNTDNVTHFCNQKNKFNELINKIDGPMLASGGFSDWDDVFDAEPSKKSNFCKSYDSTWDDSEISDETFIVSNFNIGTVATQRINWAEVYVNLEDLAYDNLTSRNDYEGKAEAIIDKQKLDALFESLQKVLEGYFDGSNEENIMLYNLMSMNRTLLMQCFINKNFSHL